MMEEIALSVTSLQSVLNCPLCFWVGEHIGSSPSIMAAIPRQIDSVVKGYMKQFIGKTDLPRWFPVRGTFLDVSKTLKTKDPDSGVTLKGALDALVRTDDGKYCIIDYKTGKPPEEVPNYYQMQLDGYAYLLERNGLSPVGDGVLLYFTPTQGEISEYSFPFKMTTVRAKVDPTRIPPVLARARQIIEMEAPPPHSADCGMCMWLERVGQTLSGP